MLGGEEQAYADRVHPLREGRLLLRARRAPTGCGARYTAPDGSVVVSDTLSIRVLPPATAEDVEVADLSSRTSRGC